MWRSDQFLLKDGLQKLQNLPTRKILGVFKTAPTKVMGLKAGILLTNIWLDDITRKYAMRIKFFPQ